MKLAKKMTLFIVLYSGIGIIILYSLTNIFIFNSYTLLENKNFNSEIELVRNIVHDKISRLREVTIDWAYWDDTYEFLNNKNEKYIESNISPSTFYNLKMKYLIMFDEHYNVIFNYEYDKINNSLINGSVKLANAVKNVKNVDGLIYLDGQAIVVSTSEITDTSQNNNAKGLIVFGYEFNESIIKNIESRIDVNIEIENNTIINNQNINIKRYKTYSDANFQIPYLNSDKAMTIKIKMKNDITVLGRKTTMKFIFILTSSLLLFVLFLYLSLNKVIIKRLKKLSEDTYQVRNSQSISKRLDIDGNDEISELKDDINFMLDKIEKMNNEIMKHATYDELTEVYNRRAGIDKLKEQIDICKNRRIPLSIAYIDVNDLKIVNDSNNHQMGDQLLIDVVNLIQNNIRQADDICRLGGDEFLLILPDTNFNDANFIFEKIEKSILQFNIEKSRPYYIEISKGIVEYNNKMNIDDFIDLADEYMYIDKKVKKEVATTSDN